VSNWSIAGAWVLVAALATTLTWQIVSAADAQVSERPPLQVDAPLASSSDSTTTTTVPPTTSTSLPGSTSSSTTTTSSASSSTTPGSSSTSAPPPTTGAWTSQSIPTAGGVVVVSFRPEEVVLSSASPAAGFAAEIKKQGPPEVDVEFESESAKFRVRARYEDGALSVEIDSD